MATLVSEALRKNHIEAFLSGGAVVTIYSENEYQSWDLDFISHADRKKIKKVMESIGFKKENMLEKYQEFLDKSKNP